MDDLAFVQIIQAAQHGLGDLGQNFFTRPTSSPRDLPNKGVERSSLAKFHQNPDTRVRVGQERPVVFDNVGRLAFVQELELTKELFVNSRVRRGGDDLERHAKINDQDKAQRHHFRLTFMAKILPVFLSLTFSTAPPAPSPNRINPS